MVDRIKNGDIQIIINTSVGRKSTRDAYHIRRGALVYNILYTTTLAGARALSEAVMALKQKEWTVTPLQDYHRQCRKKEDYEQRRNRCGSCERKLAVRWKTPRCLRGFCRLWACRKRPD